MLSACESKHERETREMESSISATIQTDWRDGIPLDSLVEAGKMCREHADLRGCGAVESQMSDIAVSLASCRADERSRLCQAVVRGIGKHPIMAMLPEAKPIILPDTFWYWSLPTSMLDSLSNHFSYRTEIVMGWWGRWRIQLISCAALLSLTYGVRVWGLRRKKAIQERAWEVANQRAADEVWEKICRVLDNEARAEIADRVKLAREAGIALQQKHAAEKHAQQQAAEASARLAAEQAESAMLLNAAFKPASKPKRGEHVTSSQ